MAPDYSLKRNVLLTNTTLTLAKKLHQMIVDRTSVSHPKSKLEVVNVPARPVDVQKREIVANLRQRCSKINQPHSANC